ASGGEVEDQAGEEDQSAEEVDEDVAHRGALRGGRDSREEAEDRAEAEHVAEREEGDEVPGHDRADRAARVEQARGEIEGDVLAHDVEDADEGDEGEDVGENEAPAVGAPEDEFELEQVRLPVNPRGDEVEVQQADRGNGEGEDLPEASPEKGDDEGTEQVEEGGRQGVRHRSSLRFFLLLFLRRERTGRVRNSPRP